MYIKRKIYDYLKSVLDKEGAIVLIGTRQVGKSTLMRRMEEEFRLANKRTFYFDLEMSSALSIFSGGAEGFFEYLKAQGIGFDISDTSQYIYVFIDEFQYIVNGGKFLKILIDNFRKIKIIASGSSSVEIQKSLIESSVGRKRLINIFALDFSEHLYFSNVKEADFFENIDINKPLSKPLCDKFRQLFDRFIIWGGMPKVALESDLEERRAILEEICSAYLQKDVKALLGSENLVAFNKLMILLAEESSLIINTHSLSGATGSPRKELEKYLFVLENTFVNYLAAPFFTNKRKELSKSKKSVFYDNGMRNHLIGNLSGIENRMQMDAGRLVETAVYNEMRKNARIGMHLLYWRTQRQTEVDFVLKYDEKTVPIEIKAGSAEKPPLSLLSFASSYNCPFGVVVNKDNWNVITHNGLKVYFIPAFLSSFIPSLLYSTSADN